MEEGISAASLATMGGRCQKPSLAWPLPAPSHTASYGASVASNASHLTARPGHPLRGTVRAPGDKSISHRSMILGAMASGVTKVEGLLEGVDVLATARAAEAFGATVEKLGGGRWRITGRGGFQTPTGVIDCGNAGTGVRLLMGAAAQVVEFGLAVRTDLLGAKFGIGHG